MPHLPPQVGIRECPQAPASYARRSSERDIIRSMVRSMAGRNQVFGEVYSMVMVFTGYSDYFVEASLHAETSGSVATHARRFVTTRARCSFECCNRLLSFSGRSFHECLHAHVMGQIRDAYRNQESMI